MKLLKNAVCLVRRKAIGASAALVLISSGAGFAHAGYITTPNITPIYSQAAFGNTPITINWLAPGAPIYSQALAFIDDAAEWAALLALAPDASPTVNVFFVSGINWCGISAPNIVGCAEQPGYRLAVDSDFVANDPLGGVDVAHELGHNLNLGHIGDDTAVGNLMNPVLNSSVLDNAINANAIPAGALGQIDQILASGLIQLDAQGNRFINLRPIAVIPEPATLLLVAVALGLIPAGLRRGNARAVAPV